MKEKTYQKWIALAAAATFGATIFMGCSAATTQLAATEATTQSAQSLSASAEAAAETTTVITSAASTGDYTKKDTDDSYDEETTVKIELNGSSASASGTGVTIDGSTVTITTAGTYIVSGTLTDGQLVVDAGENDDVQIVLNGAEVTCSTSAAIYAKSADKVILTLVDGSQNVMTDGESYTYADAVKEEPNAAVFAKCDLSINGSGSLTVTGSFNNGIGTKDDLVITGGTINITAINNGLKGHDSVSVLDGDITIEAGGDGIKADNENDTEKGWIILDNGTYHITAGNDGIQAETTLTVNGGTFDITSGGGSANAEERSQEAGFSGRGQIMQTETTTDTTSEESYKGMKAGDSLSVNAGTFSIDSADDAVHSNGDIALSSSSLTIAAGDDGVHADGTLTSTADINITECYEGLEGSNIVIDGGSITIVSSDDGLNAAGGSDETTQGMFGQDQFSSGSNSLTITDGNINMICGGDGIDSNGTVDISGGYIVSLISSTPDNGGIDCDGTFTATGGTIIYGGTGLESNPAGNSTQSYVYFDSGVTAGTEVTLQQDGQTLVTFTPALDCQYLAISSPDVKSGESYTLCSNDSQVTTAKAGTGGDGMMGAGNMQDGGGPRGMR